MVSYEELLELALTSHDPTRPAFKTQYASLALAHDEAQLTAALAVAQRFEARGGRKLATRIEPLKRFYLAEDYHQKYYLRNDHTLAADFRAMFGDDEDALRESTAAARVNGFVAGDGTNEQLTSQIDSLGLSEAGRAELVRRVGKSSGGMGCSIA